MGSRKSVSAILLGGVTGTIAVTAYTFIMRPWLLCWGATADEADQPLPGDELVPQPILETTRAVTIHASAAEIWPWLVQMGQGRGGFYSYDWLENLLKLDIHSTDSIVPELQHLQSGDLIPFWQGGGVYVISVEPQRALVLAGRFDGAGLEALKGGEAGGSWVFILKAINAGMTRLIVRTRVAGFPPAGLSTFFMRLLAEPAHFVMERKMLLGITRRVEAKTRMEVSS